MNRLPLAFALVVVLAAAVGCVAPRTAADGPAEASTPAAAATDASATAIGSSPQSWPALTPGRTFYAGTVQPTAPDGSAPYGPPKPGLVARTVEPGAARIVEVVVDEGALRTTTLIRRGDGVTFDASDDEGTFSGTLTFDADGWRYNLAFREGGFALEGRARLDADGLHTEKFVVAPNGPRTVRIVEELRPISEADYRSRLSELGFP